jgi:hypothetical protein
MTSTSARLAETGPQKRGQDPTGRKLWEPGHRSGGDFDLDGHQRLSRGLLTLIAKRIDVELERASCPVNRLSAGSAVYVASGNLLDRLEKTHALDSFVSRATCSGAPICA